jgi:uncharacterized protein (TIGR00369 family)
MTDPLLSPARFRHIGDDRLLGSLPASAPADASRTLFAVWDDVSAVVQQAPTMSGLELLLAIQRGELPGPPVHHVLGIVNLLAEAGHVVFEMTPHELHYNPMGVVHGGVLSLILDSALGCTVLSTLPAGTGYTTVDLHVTMTRAVTSRTGRIRADGRILHQGRTIATAEGRLTDGDGKLLAHAVTTCAIMAGTHSAARR